MKEKNKLQFRDLLYATIVMLSGVVFGGMIPVYLDSNHPSYNLQINHVYISMFLFAGIFFVFWLITSIILLGKNVLKVKGIIYCLRKDALTYIPFYFMYIYKFNFSINRFLPFLIVIAFLFFKFIVFKDTKNIILDRIENVFIYIIKMSYLSKLNVYYKRVTEFFVEKNNIVNKIYIGLKILVILYIVLIGFSKVNKIYDIPINKPYFVGSWDEPFSINAGINILNRKGDAHFYNYGGTSSIPYAISFLAYSIKHNVKPCYKFLGKKFYESNFPIYRNIYPVKPIYNTKVFALILFTLGSVIFVSLFSWYLLPVPFVLFKMIDVSELLAIYEAQLMGNTHIALLSGITTIFFMLTFLNKDNFEKYVRNMLLCCVLVSCTVAAKISTAYIILLPISLLILMYKTFDYKILTQRRMFLKFILACIVPYLILNPGILLNTSTYLSWLRYRAMQNTLPAFTWMDSGRLRHLCLFVNDLYLIRFIPNLWLILFFIGSSVLMIKISPLVYGAVVFFHVYSFQAIINLSSDFPYSRLYLFMLLSHGIFVFFPFIYYYRKVPKYVKSIILVISLIITFNIYPIRNIGLGVNQLITGTFTKNWDKESRDDLIEYLNNNDLKIYFFEYHHFSLPENIHDKLTFFSKINELPTKLEPNQAIAFIKYNKTKEYTEEYKQYEKVTSYIAKKYKIFRKFGPEKVHYDTWTHAPASNPVILLYKEKN